MKIEFFLIIISAIRCYRALGMPRLNKFKNQYVYTTLIEHGELFDYVLGQLTYGKPEIKTIKSYYTVVHDGILYFYIKGEYYNFAIDDDGVTVALAQTILINYKVMHFSRRKSKNSYAELSGTSEKSSEENTNVHSEDIHGEDNSEDTEYQDSHSISSTTESEEENYHKGAKRRKKNHRNQQKSENIESGTDKFRRNKTKHRHVAGKKHNKRHKPFLLEKVDDGEVYSKSDEGRIEDDKKLSRQKGFNLKVVPVEKGSDKFVLKKEDSDTCLTFYRERFIMSSCFANKNQIFSLTNTSKILKESMKKHHKKKKLEEEKKDIDFDFDLDALLSSAENEESASSSEKGISGNVAKKQASIGHKKLKKNSSIYRNYRDPNKEEDPLMLNIPDF